MPLSELQLHTKRRGEAGQKKRAVGYAKSTWRNQTCEGVEQLESFLAQIRPSRQLGGVLKELSFALNVNKGHCP